MTLVPASRPGEPRADRARKLVHARVSLILPGWVRSTSPAPTSRRIARFELTDSEAAWLDQGRRFGNTASPITRRCVRAPRPQRLVGPDPSVGHVSQERLRERRPSRSASSARKRSSASIAGERSFRPARSSPRSCRSLVEDRHVRRARCPRNGRGIRDTRVRRRRRRLARDDG